MTQHHDEKDRGALLSCKARRKLRLAIWCGHSIITAMIGDRKPSSETSSDRMSADLVHVKIADETIEATMLHPFWGISGKDLLDRPMRSHLESPPEDSKVAGRWVDATDLRPGDQLLLRQAVTSSTSAPTQSFTISLLMSYAATRWDKNRSWFIIRTGLKGLLQTTFQDQLRLARTSAQKSGNILIKSETGSRSKILYLHQAREE